MTDDETSTNDIATDAGTQPPLFVLGVGAAGMDADRLAELLDAVGGASNLAIMLLLRDRQLLMRRACANCLAVRPPCCRCPMMVSGCNRGASICRRPIRS